MLIIGECIYTKLIYVWISLKRQQVFSIPQKIPASTSKSVLQFLGKSAIRYICFNKSCKRQVVPRWNGARQLQMLQSSTWSCYHVKIKSAGQILHSGWHLYLLCLNCLSDTIALKKLWPKYIKCEWELWFNLKTKNLWVISYSWRKGVLHSPRKWKSIEAAESKKGKIQNIFFANTLNICWRWNSAFLKNRGLDSWVPMACLWLGKFYKLRYFGL